MSLRQEIKEIRSSNGDLRRFGVTMGIAGVVLFATLWFRGKEHPSLLLGASFFCLFFAIVFPIVLKPFQKVWMSLAFVIGWFVTRALLIVIFYLVFMPLSIILKCRRKDLLDTQIGSGVSYWRDHVIKSKDSYEKQY